jgi:hypothetical protein
MIATVLLLYVMYGLVKSTTPKYFEVLEEVFL